MASDVGKSSAPIRVGRMGRPRFSMANCRKASPNPAIKKPLRSNRVGAGALVPYTRPTNPKTGKPIPFTDVQMQAVIHAVVVHTGQGSTGRS